MKYRATIEKIVTTHEVVEFDAADMVYAAQAMERYVNAARTMTTRRFRREKLQVLQPFDADPKEDTRVDVVKIEERP